MKEMSLAQYAQDVPSPTVRLGLDGIQFPDLGSIIIVRQFSADVALSASNQEPFCEKRVFITRGFLDTFNSFKESGHGKLIGYPLCGKTTFLMLIKKLLESAGIHCTYLRFWRTEANKDLLSACSENDEYLLEYEIDTFLNDIQNITKKGVVLFDEIQRLKTLNMRVYGELLFGLASISLANFFAAGIVTSIDEAQPSSRTVNRIISSKLRLSDEEAKAVVPIMTQLLPQIWGDAVLDQIVSFALAESNNMIGIAERLLAMATASFRDQTDRCHLDVEKAVSWMETAQFKPDQHSRLAPSLNALSANEGVINLLRRMLFSGQDDPQVEGCADDPYFLLLFQSGLVEYNPDTQRCSFLSRWARRLCKHVVAVQDSTRLNQIEYDWTNFDATKFIETLLANSNWEMIYQTESIRYDNEISEHVFQQTFYSTILKMLEAVKSERPVASPEKYCSQNGGKGYLDHFINSKVQVGIEYLVGNKTVKENGGSVPDFEQHVKSFDCTYKGIILKHRICIALTNKENIFNAYNFDVVTSVEVRKFAVLVNPKTLILKIRCDEQPTATRDLPWIPIEQQDERPAKRLLIRK